MADFLYNSFKQYVVNGTIDLDGDVFKCVLLGDNHTPDSSDTHLNDISAEQTSGTGYTAGGASLTSVTLTLSGGVVEWDAADVQWDGSASFTARYAVVYSDTASGDALVGQWDFTENKTVSSGTFTIQWNDAGLMQVS
jgi:hypothetical protein